MLYVKSASELAKHVPFSTFACRVLAENASDHMNVLLREPAHSLMTRIIVSNNKFLIAICPSEALDVSSMLGRWAEILFTQIGS